MARATSKPSSFSAAGPVGWPLAAAGPTTGDPEVIEGFEFDGTRSIEDLAGLWSSEMELEEAPGTDGVTSPWGATVARLPGASTIRSLVDGWGPGDPQFSLYSDEYVLASGQVWVVSEDGAFSPWSFERARDDTAKTQSGQVEWAGSTTREELVQIAASLLCSTVSEEIVFGLIQPMGFLGRRLRLEFENAGVEYRATLPVFDPFTTPTRRAIRRYFSLMAQDFDHQPGHRWVAVGEETETTLKNLRAAVIAGNPTAGTEETELPSTRLQFDDQEDRPFNPIIGTITSKSPFIKGFWRPGGLFKLVHRMLMPLRTEPDVACLPLNWQVNNLMEFVPTYMEWLDWYKGRRIAAGSIWILELMLEDEEQLDAATADAIVQAVNYINTVDQKMVVMTPEVKSALLGGEDGLDLEKLRDDLGISLESLSTAVSQTLDRVEQALDTATTTGMSVNDCLAWFLSDMSGALNPLAEWRFWGNGLPVDETTEEKLLMGLGKASYEALYSGLFGSAYEEWLSSLDPTGLMTDVVEHLRERHEAALPVFMLDEDVFNWIFDDFDQASADDYDTEIDGLDLGPWVSRASPLIQLVLAIETASALLEAGIQAESLPCAISGLATGGDSMGQQVREALALVGMGMIHRFAPDLSLSRFFAAIWRQTLVDRALLEFIGDTWDGLLWDRDGIYEVIPWMRTATQREQVDRLLGPLDSARGGRRWEEGMIGVLGGARLLDDGSTLQWDLAESFDLAWSRLSAEEREVISDCVATLVDREGLIELRGLLEQASGPRSLGGRSASSGREAPDSDSAILDDLSAEPGRVPVLPDGILWTWADG